MGALGLNLLLALAVLGPGFGVYFGVFSGRATVRSAPPAPNSAGSLGVITVGALACHLLCATVLLLNDWAAAALRGGVRLPFDPNLYRLALSSAEGGMRLTFEQAWGLLVVDLLLTIVGYGLCGLAFRRRALGDWAARRLQGWAARLTAGEEEEQVLVAFVLTDTEVGGAVVGYEGVLIDLGLTADKTVTSVLLEDVTLFHMQFTDGHVSRVEDPRDDVIPQLLIEGAHIRNIAFRRFHLTSGDPV